MPVPSKEETQKETVQLMARRLGLHHKPCVYLKAIKDEFGMEVSNSVLTKSIGSLFNRLQSDERQLVKHGKQLLKACRNDKGLANYIINKCDFVS